MFHNCIVERSEKEREKERERERERESNNETKHNELDTIQRWLHTETI